MIASRPFITGFLLLMSCALLSGCDVDLYGKLDEVDANRMVSTLDASGIDARKDAQKDGSFTLRVATNEFARSVAILDAAGLPGEPRTTLKDMFQGGGLVATPAQEQAQLTVGLGAELARTIGTIDGVVTARVHVVLAERTPLKREAVPASAAVFIRHAPDAAIGNLVPQVKQLVASSIGGLAYDNVTVVTVPAALDAVRADHAPRYANVLGIRMLASSRPLALWLLAIFTLILVVLVTMLIGLLRRQQRTVSFQLAQPAHE